MSRPASGMSCSSTHLQPRDSSRQTKTLPLEPAMKGFSDRFASRLFVASIVVVIFGYGMAVGMRHIFPFQIYAIAQKGYFEFCKRYMVGPIGHALPNHMVQMKKPYPPAILNTSQAYKGLNLITQIDTGGVVKPTGEALVIRVADMDAKVLHEWIIDWFKLWPDATAPTHLKSFRNRRPAPSLTRGAHGERRRGVHLYGTRADVAGPPREIVWRLPYIRTIPSLWMTMAICGFVDENGAYEAVRAIS